jgi:hypothetical protein
MTWAPWNGGVGYALTDNAQELIKFSVSGNVPTITNLGHLYNDASNGTHLVENETGGDLCADYFGRLYLVANSGNVYDIDLEDENYYQLQKRLQSGLLICTEERFMQPLKS